jgi:hypothetical protein
MAFSLFSRSLVVGSDFSLTNAPGSETPFYGTSDQPISFLGGQDDEDDGMSTPNLLFWFRFDFFLLLIDLLFTWWPIRPLLEVVFLSRHSSFTCAGRIFVLRAVHVVGMPNSSVEGENIVGLWPLIELYLSACSSGDHFWNDGPFTTVELVAAEGLTITTTLFCALIRFAVLPCLFDWPLPYL